MSKVPISKAIPCLDITFATRLKNFISDIQVNCTAGSEEKAYIQIITDRLLEYQTNNAIEQHEIDYLERCHIKPKK